MKTFSGTTPIDWPGSKSFVDMETRTTADLSAQLVEDFLDSFEPLSLPELKGYPILYWFNRLLSNKPGSGGGSKVLNQVTAWADSIGAPIVNWPLAYGKMSQTDLEAFYKRHGFVEASEAPNLLLYLPKKKAQAGMTSLVDYQYDLMFLAYQKEGYPAESLNKLIGVIRVGKMMPNEHITPNPQEEFGPGWFLYQANPGEPSHQHLQARKLWESFQLDEAIEEMNKIASEYGLGAVNRWNNEINELRQKSNS